MAGNSKETPRQKMIGLMYLVLTAMLALNVSKDILKGFITVNESLERTNAALIDNQIKTLSDFREYAKNDSIARIHLKLTEEVFKITQGAYDYVAELKSHIVAKTEKLDVKSADTLRLRYTEKQDDFDTPTYILIGDDEASPKSGAMTAKELKSKIIFIHDEILKRMEILQKDKKARLLEPDYNRLVRKVKSIYPLDPTDKVDNVKETWETQNFNQLPLAAVITNLTKIQNDIKSIETSFMGELANASRKGKIKVDEFNATVISENGYVQLGQQFRANIFLSASSSDFNDSNMQVLFGGEYDFKSKTAIKEGEPISSSEGIGKYEVSTTTTGEQVIKGAIKLKNAFGNFEYYPYEYKYMVAAPSISVSPEKMNVVYIGLDNPIAVSAAGVAPSDLIVNVSGCGAKLKPNTNGKYTLTALSRGDCYVTVSAKQSDGTTRQQGAPIKFRVKSVPTPVIKIGGKEASGTLEFAKNDLIKIGGVGAVLPSFDFEGVNFTISSYVFTMINKKGIPEEIKVTGSALPQAAKQLLADAKPGSKFYIEDVIAIGPGGKRDLGSVKVKVR